MGFRRYNGATRACRVRDGYIELKDSNIRYKTSIPVNTDWQCNMFEGHTILFLLIGDNEVYAGTKYGTIGKYTFNGLFLALYTWDVPEDEAVLVGYCKGASVTEAVVYKSEPNVVVIRGDRRSFILKDGFLPVEQDSEDIGASYLLRQAVIKGDGLCIELEGGIEFDEHEHGYWEVDPNLSCVPTLKF